MPTISAAVQRSHELPDAGRRLCGIARPVRHVRYGRRRLAVERGSWFEGRSWYDPFTHMSSGGSWGLSPTGWGSQFGFRVAAAAPLAGDANSDGRVDVNDLTVVLTNFGRSGMGWSKGEFTGSGTVDINDLTIVLSNLGQTAGTAGIEAVPEPAMLALLAAGSVGLLRRLAEVEITSTSLASGEWSEGGGRWSPTYAVLARAALPEQRE